jgi:hypothetical protein
MIVTSVGTSAKASDRPFRVDFRWCTPWHQGVMPCPPSLWACRCSAGGSGGHRQRDHDPAQAGFEAPRNSIRQENGSQRSCRLRERLPFRARPGVSEFDETQSMAELEANFSAETAGKLIRIVVPIPNALSTVKRPPWRSTISFEM